MTSSGTIVPFLIHASSPDLPGRRRDIVSLRPARHHAVWVIASRKLESGVETAEAGGSVISVNQGTAFRVREYLRGSLWKLPFLGGVLGGLLKPGGRVAPRAQPPRDPPFRGGSGGGGGARRSGRPLDAVRSTRRARSRRALQHRAAVEDELARLDASAARRFADSPDLDRARAADRQGSASRPRSRGHPSLAPVVVHLPEGVNRLWGGSVRSFRRRVLGWFPPSWYEDDGAGLAHDARSTGSPKEVTL